MNATQTEPASAGDVEEEHRDGASPAKDPDAAESLVQKVGQALGRARQVLAGLHWRWQAVIVATVVAAVAGGAWFQHVGRLPDGAAFEVGDTVVSASAVHKRIGTLKALYGVEVPASGNDRDAFERDAAKSMAVQLILQDEARSMDVAVTDKEIDAALGRIISQRYPDGGRSAFVAALGQLGASEEQVRQEVGNQILVSKLFDAVVQDVAVTTAEVRSAFLDRRADLATPERRDIANIVVADRVTANQVRARLTAGADPGALAAQYSLDGSTRNKGGDLGLVGASQLAAPYAKLAFAAPSGGVFGPVKTKFGWNVGVVRKVVAGRPAVLGKVQAALRTTLLAEKSLEEWRAWLAKAIVDHHVRYADDYRPADPDAVPDVDRASVAESGAGK